MTPRASILLLAAALLGPAACFKEFDPRLFDVPPDHDAAEDADDAAEDAPGEDTGNCAHGVCCAPGAVCCTADEHCILAGEHLACDTVRHACYEECALDGTDADPRCAAGYHCDANQCMEDTTLGACNEGSDCASGECLDGYCCEHAGLCCAVDDDCPDLFDACATDNSRTCVFSAWTFPDTGLADAFCFDAADDVVACSTLREGMDYYGQDGHYPGPTRAFTDLLDGRVHDEVTGLVWTASVTPSGMNWNTARDHCNALALGTHAWRLPRRHELQALVNYAPAAGPGLDTPFTAVGVATVWTGTPLAGDESSTAWVVDIQTGTVQRLGKVSSTPHALCVEE